MKMREIAIFLLLFLGLSIYSYFPIVSQHSIRAGGGTTLLMWSPGIAAILAAVICRRSLKGFGWLPGKPQYLLLGYFIPILYSLAAYAAVWVTGIGGVPNQEFLGHLQKLYPQWAVAVSVVAYLGNLMVFSFIPSMFKPLGEEIGWRGFLVPALSEHLSYAKVSLLVGVIWGLWHYPAILWTDYNIGTPAWFALPCFTISVIGASFISAWLRLNSKSLWPCVIWHSSHNAIIQGFFTPITIVKGHTLFFIDEFGVTLTITISVVALLCYRDQKKLSEAAKVNA